VRLAPRARGFFPGGVYLNISSKEQHTMAARTSEAEWKGNLREGRGTMKLGSGAYEGPYSFASRFESGRGTNPEELIAAAHAGCFSMALSAGLGKDGITPTRIHTTATVHLEKVGEGFGITRIELNTEAQVPDIDAATFAKYAEDAKKGCPVSKVLAGAQISLTAKLI
jgi:osmotically inducible protein OsmC